MSIENPEPHKLVSLRSQLRELYYSHTVKARRFQAVAVALDLIIIGFFMVTKFVDDVPYMIVVNIVIAALIALDLSAKAYVTGTCRRFFKFPETWADMVVLGTLLLPFMHNWGFLRILRLWALVRRERFWNTIGGGRWDDTHVEGVCRAATNLIVLIFVSAGLVKVLFAEERPELNHFVNALYFVVTALTTTGFGDITFKSESGRLFSMALMLIGIIFFFRLAQAVVAPHRRHIRCTNCGANEHEPDASYCRACGEKLP